MAYRIRFCRRSEGAPIDVVKLARTGLQVPATAEVVIEGECLPGGSKTEGPFGEWTGYYASHVREEPVIRIRRMYFRNDPIMAGAPPSRPPTEATFTKFLALGDGVGRVGARRRAGCCRRLLPARKATHACSPSSPIQPALSGPRVPGRLDRLTVSRRRLSWGVFTVVVDDDIDPTDMKDVWWAMTTRCDPAEDIEILRRCWSGPLDPIVQRGKKRVQFARRHRRLPALRMDQRFSRSVIVPPDLAQQVRQKWGKADLVLSHASMLFDRAAVLEVAQKTRVEKILGL